MNNQKYKFIKFRTNVDPNNVRKAYNLTNVVLIIKLVIEGIGVLSGFILAFKEKRFIIMAAVLMLKLIESCIIYIIVIGFMKEMLNLAYEQKSIANVDESFKKRLEEILNLLDTVKQEEINKAIISDVLSYNSEEIHQRFQLLYESGDFERAIKVYNYEIENNVIEAYYYLGNCYYYGEGVSRNFKKAFELYLKGSKDSKCRKKVKLCYENGIGVAKDLEMAKKFE